MAVDGADFEWSKGRLIQGIALCLDRGSHITAKHTLDFCWDSGEVRQVPRATIAFSTHVLLLPLNSSSKQMYIYERAFSYLH